MNIKHTGIMSAAQAEAQQEAVMAIMAERKLNYGDALQVYISERETRQAETVDMSGWDAA